MNLLKEFLNKVIQQEVTAIKEPRRKSIPIDKLGITSNGGVANIIAVYNQATQAEKEYWGKWYHNAKLDVQNLAKDYKQPFELTAAIVATLSPGNRWTTNLVAAERLFQGAERINGYPRQVLKAKQILSSGDTSLVSGPKVTVFFKSLLDPKGIEKDMVLDSHAINIWRGHKIRLKYVKSPSVKERQQMIADYQTAAEQLGVPVQAVQAVTWYIWKYTPESELQPLLEQLGNNKKKMLLLVHPDIVFEMDFEVAQRYYKAIEDDIGRFDYVIVHLFYSDQIFQIAPKWGWGENKLNLFKNFLKLLKRDANVVLHDRDYSASFKEELPYYLIDNPNTTIFFAGGYKDLCVKMTQEKLDSRLGEIVKQTGATVACYAPLTINSRNQSDWQHISEFNAIGAGGIVGSGQSSKKELLWAGDAMEENKSLLEEIFYHGTSTALGLLPGGHLLPPNETEKISEKGRKKNLDKVFFTKDYGSAKIYAGRAIHQFGGNPVVYAVEPEGPVELVNATPGTTVFMSPKAKIQSIVQTKPTR
jgi:hypothetical protein